MGTKIYNLETMIENVLSNDKITDKKKAIASLIKHSGARHHTSPIFEPKKHKKHVR
jgi:hypothetical protein